MIVADYGDTEARLMIRAIHQASAPWRERNRQRNPVAHLRTEMRLAEQTPRNTSNEKWLHYMISRV